MLSIENVKKLLNNLEISDKEAEEIRDAFYMLAEIIFEKWQKERKVETQQAVKNRNPIFSSLCSRAFIKSNF